MHDPTIQTKEELIESVAETHDLLASLCSIRDSTMQKDKADAITIAINKIVKLALKHTNFVDLLSDDDAPSPKAKVTKRKQRKQ